MQLAILGTGNMGRSLGGAWAELGHAVYFGSRDREKGVETAQEIGHGSQGGGLLEAVAFAEVLFYTPRALPSEIFTDLSILNGKVIIDCGNRPVPGDKVFGPPEIPSHAQQIAAEVPGAQVIKAFNTMAQEVFHHPPERIRESGQCCFLAGDDGEAKAKVAQLVEDLGLEALDCGPLAHGWMLESAGDLIRYLIFSGKGVYATFAVPALPATDPKYGGRQQSNYH